KAPPPSRRHPERPARSTPDCPSTPAAPFSASYRGRTTFARYSGQHDETCGRWGVGPVNTSEGRLAPGAMWMSALLMATALLMSLTETVMGVALNTLREDLELPLTSIQWVVSVFPLTMAVVVPTTGYLLVRFTERQVFVAATALFAT